MATPREGFHKVIKSVASPLHFFIAIALALVAVIIFLPMNSSIQSEVTVRIISTAFVVLVVIISLVTVLVIFFPKKLTFDKEAHLTVMRENLGDSELPKLYEPGELKNVPATPTITHKANEQ